MVACSRKVLLVSDAALPPFGIFAFRGGQVTGSVEAQSELGRHYGRVRLAVASDPLSVIAPVRLTSQSWRSLIDVMVDQPLPHYRTLVDPSHGTKSPPSTEA